MMHAIKKWILPLTAIFIVFFSGAANAALIELGVDNLGHKIIYDSDLDVSWYDFTYETWSGIGSTYDEAVIWADNLSITFEGNTYSDWRLPTSGNNPQQAFVQTETELGSLFYTSLGNTGFRDENGTIQDTYGLINRGPFNNLVADHYWSSTQTGSNGAWYFNFDNGYQSYGNMGNHERVIALCDGNISQVPIPSTFLLLFPGILGLIGIKKHHR